MGRYAAMLLEEARRARTLVNDLVMVTGLV